MQRDVVLGSMFLLAISFSTSALAVKATGSASVDIVDPVSFGEIYKNDKMAENKIPNDIIIRKRLEGRNLVQKLPEREYSFKPSGNNLVQMSVKPSGSSRGVSVEGLTLNYKGKNIAGGGMVNPAKGKDSSVKLGGNIKIDNNAKAGIHKPSFEIALNYE